MAVEQTHAPTPEDIMAHLDGEGSPASRAAIEAHLAGCQECEMVADSFRRISQQAAAWTVEPSRASMHLPGAPGSASGARLLPWRTWRPSRVVMAGLTAAAAVLVIFSFTARETLERSNSRSTAAYQPGTAVQEMSTQMEKMGNAAGQTRNSAPGRQRLSAAAGPVLQQGQEAGLTRRPSVIRTASLRLVAKGFDGLRAAVEGVVAQSGGFIDQMTVTGDTSTARMLQGTLRVPGDRLTDVLARLRQLGQVVEDTQGSQDVSDQIVDLDARLAGARATEQRLTELLRNGTGKLSDVLEVERELSRVRLDIERLDAEKTNVNRRVSYATISVTITEERKAGLDAGPLSLGTRLRIAMADGLESAFESTTMLLLFVLRAGPTLLLWGAAAGIAFVVVRRVRRAQLKTNNC